MSAICIENIWEGLSRIHICSKFARLRKCEGVHFCKLSKRIKKQKKFNLVNICILLTISLQILFNSISPSATNSRSLPLSPVPAHLERPGYAISCPDGLAHALSEQNLRLQQIVYEHKVIGFWLFF